MRKDCQNCKYIKEFKGENIPSCTRYPPNILNRYETSTSPYQNTSSIYGMSYTFPLAQVSCGEWRRNWKRLATGIMNYILEIQRCK